MVDITIVSIDLDELDLDDDTRALFERCAPEQDVDLKALLTDEKVAEIMIAADLVKVH